MAHLPAWLLKECVDKLMLILTLFIKTYLHIGYFPLEWETLETLETLAPSGFAKFPPISDLLFIIRQPPEKAAWPKCNGFDQANHHILQYRKDSRCLLTIYWMWTTNWKGTLCFAQKFK